LPLRLKPLAPECFGVSFVREVEAEKADRHAPSHSYVRVLVWMVFPARSGGRLPAPCPIEQVLKPTRWLWHVDLVGKTHLGVGFARIVRPLDHPPLHEMRSRYDLRSIHVLLKASASVASTKYQRAQ
jgi:hypothetical protein